jgi:hypothetical protein
MNQNLYQATANSILSQIFRFGKLQRVCAGLAMVVSISGAALAQYPGGGGGTGTYPGGTRPSYGSKGAVIGGIAAGAAVGAGLLYWKLHNRAKLRGCVSGEGDKLVNEKTNQSYNLTNKQDQSLKPGERVELVGEKVKDASGEPTFEVHKMTDLGQCTVTTAEQR